MRRMGSIFGAFIDALDWEAALENISNWATSRQSRVVCVCNSHSVVTAQENSRFREIINAADMATPDGAPVALMLRWLGYAGQQRINGPDLMWRYCAHAARAGQSIYLYGSSEKTLASLEQRLRTSFPNLRIAGALSPPFRDITAAEDQAIVSAINDSGASVVWVGLGCPKQEYWMDAHRDRVDAVMVGVGAAFDYHAGVIRRAPEWMQRSGMEWAFRLCAEPRRLWRRYTRTNLKFLYLAALQVILGDKERK